MPNSTTKPGKKIEPESATWKQKQRTDPRYAPRMKTDRSQIIQALREKDREPFAEILGTIIQAEPSPERWTEFANEYPEKWGHLIKTMAQLTGYTERSESVNLTLDLGKLSDLEIQQRIKQHLASNGPTDGGPLKVIEGKVDEIKE